MHDPNYIPRPSRRPDGRAVIRLSGKDYYLGQAGDWPKGRRSAPPTIQAEYQGLIARWLANGRQFPDAGEILTCNDLILVHDKWAEAYYRREGRENTQIGMIRDAVRVVKNLFGREPASSFGPKKLEAVQQAMAGLGWSRSYTNEQLGRVRRMFKWAVRQELVPGGLYHALAAVPGLRKGTPGVRETEPVGPVSPEVVEATVPHLPPVVQAMIRVQLLSGARPGEVCLMRACDLDVSGPVWLYRPERHKTEHHGRRRVIPLGPQAQEVMRPFLSLNTQAYLFNPQKSEEERNAERRQNRKTPLTPSQKKRRPAKNPKRPKRDHYDETSYRNAVYRACDRAFPPPEPLARREDETRTEWLARLTPEQQEELKRWQRGHRWHPNQLRHTRATEIRRRYGLEAAQVLLGHAKADVTQVYAERDLALAKRGAAEIGGNTGGVMWSRQDHITPPFCLVEFSWRLGPAGRKSRLSHLPAATNLRRARGDIGMVEKKPASDPSLPSRVEAGALDKELNDLARELDDLGIELMGAEGPEKIPIVSRSVYCLFDAAANLHQAIMEKSPEPVVLKLLHRVESWHPMAFLNAVEMNRRFTQPRGINPMRCWPNGHEPNAHRAAVTSAWSLLQEIRQAAGLPRFAHVQWQRVNFAKVREHLATLPPFDRFPPTVQMELEAAAAIREWRAELVDAAKDQELGRRLRIDLVSNSITLDGVSYPGIDPNAVRVVDALAKNESGRPMPFRRLQPKVPGCNHENTLRRWLKKLPEPIRACIKGEPGSGRWLELPPLAEA